MRRLEWTSVPFAILATGALLLAQEHSFGGQGVGWEPLDDIRLAATYSVDTVPEDLVITPNRRVAVVRGGVAGTEPLLYFNMRNGARLTIPPSDPMPNGAGLHATISDAVAVTNTRIVSIGSTTVTSPDDTVVVDILKIEYLPGPVISLVETFTSGGGGTVNGMASDVTITPDQSKAVVTGRERVYVFDLSVDVGGGPTLLAEIPLPGSKPQLTAPSGGGGPIVDSVADSVEVTDDHAVIALNREVVPSGCGTGQERPVVHVVDLAALPPVLVSTFQLGLGFGCTPAWSHDLAITPDGSKAVVATSAFDFTVPSIALIDLDSPTTAPVEAIGTPSGGLFASLRNFVDSVVVTDTRAIVAGPAGINVYDISEGTLALTGTIGIAAGEDLHDIALSTDGDHAIVTGSVNTYVITDVNAIPPLSPTPIANPGASSPQATVPAPPPPGVGNLVSDSVVAHGDTAVVIGTDQTVNPVLAYVTFINMAAGTVLSRDVLTSDPCPSTGMCDDLLVDLTLSPNAQYLYVRGVGMPADVFGYETAGRTSIGTVTLSGGCPGVDHIEATNRGAITASDLPAPGTARVDLIEL